MSPYSKYSEEDGEGQDMAGIITVEQTSGRYAEPHEGSLKGTPNLRRCLD